MKGDVLNIGHNLLRACTPLQPAEQSVGCCHIQPSPVARLSAGFDKWSMLLTEEWAFPREREGKEGCFCIMTLLLM